MQRVVGNINSFLADLIWLNSLARVDFGPNRDKEANNFVYNVR